MYIYLKCKMHVHVSYSNLVDFHFFLNKNCKVAQQNNFHEYKASPIILNVCTILTVHL